MTAPSAVDRIESVLRDYASGMYDFLGESDPIVDIAEIIDHYRKQEQ